MAAGPSTSGMPGDRTYTVIRGVSRLSCNAMCGSPRFETRSAQPAPVLRFHMAKRKRRIILGPRGRGLFARWHHLNWIRRGM